MFSIFKQDTSCTQCGGDSDCFLCNDCKRENEAYNERIMKNRDYSKDPRRPRPTSQSVKTIF